MPLAEAMTTGRGDADLPRPVMEAERPSALATRSSVRDAAAAAPAPMNVLLEIAMRRVLCLGCLKSVFVNLDRDLAVTADPAAVHAGGVERRCDVSLPIHCDHSALAVLRHQLLHHHIIGRLLNRDSGVADPGADVG